MWNIEDLFWGPPEDGEEINAEELAKVDRYVTEWMTDPRYPERLNMSPENIIRGAITDMQILASATDEDWQEAYARLREEGHDVNDD